MGKIEALRPAAAPPVRSAEREALASAIARHAFATEALSRIEEARGKAAALRHAAERSAGQAQAAIDDAATMAPSRLIDRLLSGDDAAGGDDPVAGARAALTRAEADERTAAEAVRLLDEQIAPARQRTHLAEIAVDHCVGEVLRAEAFPQLVARFEALRHELAEMSLLLGEIGLHAPAGFHPDAQPIFRDVSRAPADAWKAAVLALGKNADAPLPTIEPPGDAPIAA